MVTNNLERLASARMLAAAGLLLAHAVSAAPATPMAVAAPEAQIAIREIKWQGLVPKDWNPKQYLPDRRLSFLSDMDPDAELAFVEMRRAWDNAPTVIGLDGVNVKLAGYLVPLEETRDGIKEFLLVPYFRRLHPLAATAGQSDRRRRAQDIHQSVPCDGHGVGQRNVRDGATGVVYGHQWLQDRGRKHRSLCRARALIRTQNP